MRDTIDMAREAAGDDWKLFQEYMPEIHRLAELVRADERARMAEQPAQQEPKFFTHCVDQPYDWSEWVCPDPKGYLMKCCDCGLVHEAEFGVVRYKSETEREECDMVNDPNLQAVFRMRRSEQWSPVDTAHRAGGLTMEQPAQQVVDSDEKAGAYMEARLWEFIDMAAAWSKASPDPRTWDHVVVYAPKPAQQDPDRVKFERHWKKTRGEKKANRELPRHPLQPQTYIQDSANRHWVTWQAAVRSVAPPAQRTWVGLTDEEIEQGCKESWVTEQAFQSAVWWAEAKLKEKNT